MYWGHLPLFIFIVVMVGIVLGVGNEMLRQILHHRERQMKLISDKAAEQASHYASKAEQLEDRVRVLERIATARGADLAAEIEDLREPRAH